ncbi:hypothetical protein FRC00_001578 [Tulasnella sp. 408]|nr:hypothetical protein FRC00_001578 [Tulasnella sp. 408]
MPPAPQPNQQQRTMKQRRVSLPASASMQSISARLDPRLNGGAASTSSSHNGTLHASEKNHLHQIMGPPSSTITQARGSGNWGARTSRDDSSLPSTSSLATNAPGSPPSPSLDYDMSNGHHHARRASASYGAAPHLALTNASDQATTAAASGSNSRRRRAATVSTNKPGAKANASNGDFIVPPDPSSSMMPSASSSTTNSNSHSTSSASSSLSPPPPEPSPPQGEPSGSNAGPPTKVRKPRKRWTMEETQALVDGCNKWGVGNWKAILNDSQFQFQGRSPVDLKDRFRTYFPDAYRFHYPNAKTHLSSRVRSFLPDGTSIFEKTRSKKRRPFSAEEDEALRLGYEKHGTTWATIVKDPIFQSQERRSTDLRDRFRNAFPELYKAAGYKPRPRASTSAASRAAAGSSTAGTSGAVTPSSTAKASTSTASEPSKKGRGRGRAASASTSQSGSVAHSASSSRRKRSSISAAGERPIGPGEPTAIDFYRPRNSHHHSSISSASTPKVAPENIPIMDSEDEESSEYEYEEEEQYFPLTSIDASQLTSGVTSPAKTESHFAHSNHHANGLADSASDLHLKSEEDMDVDGDVMFHDDELDGTALSPGGGATSPSSPSDAIHAAAGTSPVVSQSIQELLEANARSNKEQQELALELEAMIVVDAEVPGIGPADHHMQDAIPTSGPGKIHQLSVPSTSSSSQQSQSMEEAGAITPTGLNPASLPCPPSPLRLDQARLPADSTQFRRPFPPPARPHSRSVSTQGQIPASVAGGTGGAGLYHRPTTPSAWARDSSRSISQPPSEHRQALQRSLSYLDPMITTHVGLGGGGGGIGGLPQVLDDPLAYNEPLSISSLDLQYGMSSGPNIFTPLTMFSDPPSIAPLRTLNSTSGRNGASAASAGSAQQQAGSTSTAATANGSVNVAPSTEEALDLSALIHTSPIPAHRNHQRHQSQSMVAPRELDSPRDRDRKKRSSWDGGLFGMGLISATTQQSGGAAQDDATLFLDFK